MSNTLTGLIPVIYRGLNVVSRELIGFIPAVNVDATASQAAKDQTVRSPVVPALSAADITAGNIAASGSDRSLTYKDVVINKSRKVSVNLTGEEELSLGSSNATIWEQTFAQAFRTLSNEMEADLGALYTASARAYGTAGTTPFNTADDLTDVSEVMRILDDNGAPAGMGMRSVILDSAAVAKLLGKQPSMFRVNEAGGDMARKFGQLGGMFNASFGYSGQVKQHTAGAASGSSPDYLVDLATGYAVGDTTIHLDTGVGAHSAGDVIAFAGDANKYVITTGAAGNGDKDIVLGAPGLRETLADGVVATVGADYRANMAFSRDALVLATRAPALPSGGDQAADRQYVRDPVSGIMFEISLYRQYRQVSVEIAVAWGVAANKPEHMAILLG